MLLYGNFFKTFFALKKLEIFKIMYKYFYKIFATFVLRIIFGFGHGSGMDRNASVALFVSLYIIWNICCFIQNL